MKRARDRAAHRPRPKRDDQQQQQRQRENQHELPVRRSCGRLRVADQVFEEGSRDPHESVPPLCAPSEPLARGQLGAQVQRRRPRIDVAVCAQDQRPVVSPNRILAQHRQRRERCQLGRGGRERGLRELRPLLVTQHREVCRVHRPRLIQVPHTQVAHLRERLDRGVQVEVGDQWRRKLRPRPKPRRLQALLLKISDKQRVAREQAPEFAIGPVERCSERRQRIRLRSWARRAIVAGGPAGRLSTLLAGARPVPPLSRCQPRSVLARADASSDRCEDWAAVADSRRSRTANSRSTCRRCTASWISATSPNLALNVALSDAEDQRSWSARVALSAITSSGTVTASRTPRDMPSSHCNQACMRTGTTSPHCSDAPGVSVW